jgi:hypothetical protein
LDELDTVSDLTEGLSTPNIPDRLVADTEQWRNLVNGHCSQHQSHPKYGFWRQLLLSAATEIVQPDVLRLTRKHLDVFRSIVAAVLVEMVDDFTRFQSAAKRLLGYQDSSLDITSLVSAMMTGTLQERIALMELHTYDCISIPAGR